MPIHRLKKNFTAGELSPLMDARIANDRYKNGCKSMQNMFAHVQGPTTRRSGFQFIYDITSLIGDIQTDVTPRLVPFIYDEEQAYMMVFYKDTGGLTRVVWAYENGLVEDPLSPGNPYTFEFTSDLDIEKFKFVQSADVLFIVQPDYTPIEFRRLAHDEWEANDIVFTERPFLTNKDEDIVMTPSGTTGTVTLTTAADLFTADFVGQQIKINNGIVLIDTYTDAQTASGDTLTDLDGVTATYEWSSADWGPVNGYPSQVGFFEQRICYASTAARPQTLWFSRSGDYYDFSVSSPIVASDAATFTLDSGSQNKIQWIMSARQMLVGTLGDEWAVSGSGYEPLSFQSIRAARHTNNGSEILQPLMIGPVTIFLERLGRTVNQFIYDYNSDSYTIVDLSVLAPHLTEEFTITDWDYQQTPNGIIWCVREDGIMMGLTFKREHKVTGWHRHITDGSFVAVGCIPGSEEDEVWTVIDREIEGVNRWYLERMAPGFRSDDATDGRFLDSYLHYSGVPATVISGLDHLEGETVSILADGAVRPDEVVASGSITLAIEASEVTIGLPYVSEIEPLALDVETKDGTTLGRTQRVTQVVAGLHRSLGMEIGRIDEEDGEHMEVVPFRVPGDLTGTAVPIFSGSKRITFPEGFDRRTRLLIRQSQPLPLTVVGLVDYLEVFE